MHSSRRYGRSARAKVLTGVLLLALGGGCFGGGDSATDFGSNDPSVVVGLGDSITFGVFDNGNSSCSAPGLGYCPRLQDLAGKTVINEGRCGDDSDGGVARIGRVLQRWRPGVILLDFSPNDIFNGSDHVIRNLRTMIAAARANQTIPIIGTLVPAVGTHLGWEYFIQDLNVKILALCDEEGVLCADHHTAFISNPGFAENPFSLLSEDGEHPNAAGYTLMAETWRGPLLSVY